MVITHLRIFIITIILWITLSFIMPRIFQFLIKKHIFVLISLIWIFYVRYLISWRDIIAILNAFQFSILPALFSANRASKIYLISWITKRVAPVLNAFQFSILLANRGKSRVRCLRLFKRRPLLNTTGLQ